VGLGLWLAAMSASAYDWLQFNGDPQHSGNNTVETVISSSNVASLAFSFQVSLPSIVDGAPVSLSGVATPGGTRDLLFVTTRGGDIIALDAHTGGVVWSRQYPAGSCRVNGGDRGCYTSSSPAVDPNRLYVYSYGLDGYVHKLQVGDGTEISTGGWPQLATTKAFNEKGSSALSFATAENEKTYLYVTNGGYPGDLGDYQGHVTAIDLATGTQNVFNADCSDQAVHFVQTPGTPDCSHVQSAIWARGGVVYDEVTDRIFMATGNGDYDGNLGMFDWGDSVIALNPDGTGGAGKPLDAYTPGTFASLQSQDLDLGSTSPAILPAHGYSGRLAVQAGKDANLRLINLANLSGKGAPGNVGGQLQTLAVAQGCEVVTVPAVWINPADESTWVFVANDCGISGLKLSVAGARPALLTKWQSASGGSSPLLANNVLFYAGDGFIRALDPSTGNLLWTNTANVGQNHWQSPVVVNGTLYISDQSRRLTAFSLGPTLQAVSPRWGPTDGGTVTTLTGAGFQEGAAVTFGGLASPSVSVIDATTVIATTPPREASAVNVVLTNPGGGAATLARGFTFGDATFVPIPLCRAVDTRNDAGPLGGPALEARSNRRFPIVGSCGIPPTAKALSINVTVTQPTVAGSITLYQGDTNSPSVESLDYGLGQTRANNAVVALGSQGDIAARCSQPSGSAHLIVDVNGYFQ
jgi:IPT/TIG domain-containing protein/putative pyrroloquinoline-quinone binding quinoprotein